ITAQKVASHLSHRNARKRGGGIEHVDGVRLESGVGNEPPPDLALIMDEGLEQPLTRLGNERLRQNALWKMERLTHQEISERLGWALRTVANKMELIRKTLLLAHEP